MAVTRGAARSLRLLLPIFAALIPLAGDASREIAAAEAPISSRPMPATGIRGLYEPPTHLPPPIFVGDRRGSGFSSGRRFVDRGRLSRHRSYGDLFVGQDDRRWERRQPRRRSFGRSDDLRDYDPGRHGDWSGFDGRRHSQPSRQFDYHSSEMPRARVVIIGRRGRNWPRVIHLVPTPRDR